MPTDQQAAALASIDACLVALGVAVADLRASLAEPAPTDPPPVEPPASVPSVLHQIAATLSPGEWRRVDTTWDTDTFKSFKDLQNVQFPDVPPGGPGIDGLGWTDGLIENKGRLFALLMRDPVRTLGMITMTPELRWTRHDYMPGLPHDIGGRRGFNRLCSDGQHLYFAPLSKVRTEMGYMVRTPLDNPGAFERYGIPIGDDQMDTTGNFSMEYVPSWGRFVAYTPGGHVWSWADGEASWRDHWSSVPREQRSTGYAGRAIWNPVRDEVLCAGGQYFGDNSDTSHRALVLRGPDQQAVPVQMENADGSLVQGVSSGSTRFVCTHDGRYLRLAGRMLHQSEDAHQWRLYEDVSVLRPWGNYETYCPMARLSGTDCIVMVSHVKGVWLHRVHPKE